MPYYATNPDTIVVGPLQVVVNRPINVDLSDGYLTAVIENAWVGFGGTLPLQSLSYWKEKATNPEVFSDKKVRVGWNGYWEARLYQEFTDDPSGSASPALAGYDGVLPGTGADYGFTEGGDEDDAGVYAKPVPLYVKAQKGITPQLGLLEDDILYNLSLLAVNILEPLKQQYPDIYVSSGFRQVNSGISQHERGEAVDIRLGYQTPERLYTVADYITKRLPFDQLVLNYSLHPVQSWIHVSFSAQSLRYQVLTRDYDDTFHDGLFLIEELTGESRAAALREQAEYLGLVETELKDLAIRDKRLNPSPVIGDQPLTTTEEDTLLPGVTPDKSGVVLEVWNAGGGASGWGFTADNPGALENPPFTTNAGIFVDAVVLRLKNEIDGAQWGNYSKVTDRNYNNHSADGIAFLGSPGDKEQAQQNGVMVTFVQILSNSDTTNAAPGWTAKFGTKDTEKFSIL